MDLLNALVALSNFVLIPTIAYGSQLALGALGVTMIYGILRFSNFAHGGTMAFGTMIAVMATSAHSVTPPGPPPYYCFVVAVCDSEKQCLEVKGVPTRFLAFEFGDLLGRSLIFEGLGGSTIRALFFGDLDSANASLTEINPTANIGAIAISRRDLADGVGYIIHGITTRNDQRIIAATSTMVNCTSIARDLY
jgi:hypothetical protein